MDIQPDDRLEITNSRIGSIKFVTNKIEGSDIMVSLLFENGGRLNAYATPESEVDGTLNIQIESSATPSA